MSTELGRQVELIRQQAAACEELGSPFYAVLLERLAQEVSEAGRGPVSAPVPPCWPATSRTRGRRRLRCA
ncbi:DUF2332 domain-containing protein [Ornithinimicrobium cryptoxanthini]|uniref:DUF2332 domain-containing protein n=1 Tax=Ornithinimicrobium cryptoxanthini TaxID=2934161 RepID=UPI0021193A37|nr:DUF2332 domain-containing protein [Ornithinimicrobium cryptoxanthini]